MTRCGALVMSVLLIGPVSAIAADECQVPKQMKKEQKLPCVRTGSFMLDQPTLTLEQLTNGPDFDPADPTGSRFLYFTAQDEVICYFRPHYAFKSVKGQSLKYQCWQMKPDRTLYDAKGQTINVGELKVVVEKNKGGENRSHLYARSDTANANELEADRIKVKYLDAPPPNHNTRYNEAFTEIAASRILWALGFPSDHEYPAGKANCVGCTRDPFKDNLKANTANIHDTPVTFQIATIGRENGWDEIDPENDETWSWRDVASFYRNGQFSRQQKVEYDAYRMALGLFTYHNAIDVQNRLACAEWKEGASNPKICVKPMVFVQDLGSTFGKPKTFLGANPRGRYSAWVKQTVFSNAGKCELKYPLDGDRVPLKEAQDLLAKRLEKLDRERVKAIFRVARFQLMDQEQLKRLRESGTANVEEAALNEWTDAFMNRAAEIRAAQNCKP